MSQAKVLTNQRLKGLLTDALVFRGNAPSDLNDCRQWGLYHIQCNEANLPPGLTQGSVMEVMQRLADRIIQRIVTQNAIYWRFCIAGVWEKWYYVSGTKLT
jgi:hypothetical protein